MVGRPEYVAPMGLEGWLRPVNYKYSAPNGAAKTSPKIKKDCYLYPLEGFRRLHLP
jgi:hypothetical protein